MYKTGGNERIQTILPTAKRDKMASFRKFTKAIKALTSSPTKKTSTVVTTTKRSIRRLTEAEFAQLECAQATREILGGMRGSPFTEDEINSMPEFGPLRTPPVFAPSQNTTKQEDAAMVYCCIDECENAEVETTAPYAWMPKFASFQEADEFFTGVMNEMDREREMNPEDYIIPPLRHASTTRSPPSGHQVVPRRASTTRSPPSEHQVVYPRVDDDILPAYDDNDSPYRRMYPRLDDLPAYSYY